MGSVDFEWFAVNLITTLEEAKSVALSGDGCANRWIWKVASDNLEKARKWREIRGTQ